jgi:hypothetical protein
MGKNPGETKNRLETILKAWTNLRKDKSYAGISLEDFKKYVQPSFDIRDEISSLEERLRGLRDRRDDIDKQNLAKAERIVEGVIGEEGRDGEMYQALGYVRKSEKESGLTRKKLTSKPQ